ncbi:MAG: hypothetical protein WCH40_06185 [Verrucomicrobiales bacterium]
MRTFKWIEWNIDKIDAHALTVADVEASFDRAYSLPEHARVIIVAAQGD